MAAPLSWTIIYGSGMVKFACKLQHVFESHPVLQIILTTNSTGTGPTET